MIAIEVASQCVISVNSGQNVDSNIDVDVDLEEVINNGGTEWVNVDAVPEISECSLNVGQGASWARVVSKSQSPGLQHGPGGGQDFGVETVQHKAQVQPVFLAYHRVQSVRTVQIPLYQIASSVA